MLDTLLLAFNPGVNFTYFPSVFEILITVGLVVARAVPVNTLMTEDDYRFMLADSRAKVLVIHADLWRGIGEAVPASVTVIVGNRVGSMITPFFTAGPVTDYASATKSDTARYGAFHRAMLENASVAPDDSSGRSLCAMA